MIATQGLIDWFHLGNIYNTHVKLYYKLSYPYCLFVYYVACKM